MLIRQLGLSDEEIAVVIGHEIAHALREHSREQVSQAIAAQAAIGLGAELLDLGQASADMDAGYDPRAGVSLWQKMITANSGGRPPEFLGSHPTESSRVQQIEALLPSVMPLYTAARRGG